MAIQRVMMTESRKEDGTKLFESQELKPGEGLENITLDQELSIFLNIVLSFGKQAVDILSCGINKVRNIEYRFFQKFCNCFRCNRGKSIVYLCLDRACT